MTESDAFHVFDGSAGNVISISSYIETVGLFSNRPLSKGLLGPREDDSVLTCVAHNVTWGAKVLARLVSGQDKATKRR